MRIEDLQGRQFGRYTITGLLGRGGMAAVYRAHDTVLRRDVAFKVLYPQYAGDPTLVTRFTHEAVLAARLEHPNIVPIYDIGEDGGLVYIAMKLLPGHSLAEQIQVRPQLPLDVLLPIVEQIAAALDYAHANGVVHRDIKPANILLEPPDRAILTDFGIAKSLVDAPNLTSTSMIIGTPDYMAPEQITRQPITPRTDIYALGVLVFRCLTGRRPFDGGTEQVLLGHLYGEPPAPSTLVAGLTPAVDQVVLAAMARDPQQRPATAGALAQALRAALTNQQPTAVLRAPAGSRIVAPRIAGGGPLYAGAAADAATLAAPVVLPSARPAAVRRWGGPTTLLALLALVLLGTAGALLAGQFGAGTSGQPTPALPTSPVVVVVPTQAATTVPTLTPSVTLAAASTTTPTESPTASPTEAPTSAPTLPPAPTAPPARPTTARPPATSVPATQVPPTQPPATATATPTATAAPPTATAVPPSPTATPCPVAVISGFGALLDNRPDLRQALGCPIEAESGSEIAEEPFQRGSMIWFDLDKYIYVLYGRDSGRFQIYPPDQTVGNDPAPPDPPTIDLYRPTSGFGTVWNTHSEVFDGLGWATAPESGPFDGAYQPFANGLMLFSPTGVGRGPTIYVLLYSGRQFIRFDDVSGSVSTSG